MRRRTMLTAAVAGTALAGCSSEGVHDAQPRRHPHQAGVVTPPPSYAAFVALDVTGSDLAAPLWSLASRLASIEAAVSTTATVAVGASLFDDRFGLSPFRPHGLTAMPAFPSDVLEPSRCHGDLLLQVCSDRPDETSAVVSDLVASAGAVRTRWRMDGFRPENEVTADGMPSTRNLFGFREGAGNPDPRDEMLMDRLVWVADGEPAWAAGGTYQVVRLIRMGTQLWNRDPIPLQEQAIGRHRGDGSPLAGGPEDARFTYSGDPDGQVTPLDAHIRRANPRTPEDERHRVLRRGYSYRSGSDQGLVFVCFQHDIEAGFATIQRRLDGEALQQYVLPFGGGYYFVPPSFGALTSIVTKS